MVTLSVVLVFLLVLSRSESELDTKISSPGEATEWGDPDRSLPGSCQPAPSCQKCILSHPSCAWCKQLVKMAYEPCVGVCAAWIYVCDCMGTCVIFQGVLCSPVRDSVCAHRTSVCDCLHVCINMHARSLSMYVYVCICVFVYIWTRLVTEFGGSMFLLEHTLVYR